ncbi:MAG: CoA-binding protein [Chloroflexota bacterium]|nr:CoA-binding protein [Chloroflexota bacterium]
MSMPETSGSNYARPEDISRILNLKTIAVVGLSPDPFRPSHTVALYMQRHGYRVVPVNPYCELVLNERVYPDVESIPFKIDVVNIFRRSSEVAEIVEAAIRKGAKAVWMQEGVVDDLAAERARRAGLLVVMDRCMLKEHAYLAEHPELASSTPPS